MKQQKYEGKEESRFAGPWIYSAPETRNLRDHEKVIHSMGPVASLHGYLNHDARGLRITDLSYVVKKNKK